MSEKNENINKTELNEADNNQEKPEIQQVKHVSGMYKNWFLDYASYVILERAVPHILDGLKPVQRRILHAMKRLDDGRFNKVANVIGYTMQYHPHGDASIGDAMVQLGQKDLLIETQGNWGNVHTGDNAAAPRYIEARLSKFALEVAFNPKTTTWKLSYDGRNKEPICLPMKFPLLLAQGVEGIAVGLASKILPHNFNELIEASIKYLRKEEFELYPDFETGGMADVSKYNDGLRGGKVRVRAKINKLDRRTLVIKDLPFGKNTNTLIESILAANDKGKIKIKKIDDNTAAEVEILLHLPNDVDADKMIDALYAVTDCEVSISPNVCIIQDNKPLFLGVSEILKFTTDNTLSLLKLELEIRKQELEDEWHFSSLEKIFIENRIYIQIEECETWEAIIKTIDKGLEPFKPLLKREVTEEDIAKLTEIKIKRISKFDAFKADERIKKIEEEIEQINYNLVHIVDFTIDYYKRIQEKFGKGRERKTELRSFDVIEATKVVVKNEKLYINREDGFVGTGLKKDEYLFDCSDIDDLIVFRKSGIYYVTKVADKLYVGKDVLYVARWKRGDERTIYNAIYRDGKTGHALMKRFAVKAVTRDKEYDLTQGTPNSKVLYFTANRNGEAEKLKVTLRPRPRLKKLHLECDFKDLAVKGRTSKGNILTRNAIHRITVQEEGISTLGGRDIWFDPETLRLNTDEKGTFLGEFKADDKILVIYKNGTYSNYTYNLNNHFDAEILIIEKFNPEKIFSAVYYEADLDYYYVKRFEIEENTIPQSFIGENLKSKLKIISDEAYPRVEVIFGGKDKNRYPEIVELHDFIAVKGYKARGKRLTNYEVKEIKQLEPIITEKDLAEMEKMKLDFNLNDENKEASEKNQHEDDANYKAGTFNFEITGKDGKKIDI